MRETRISKTAFRDSLRPIGDAAWVRMDVDSIQGSNVDWIVVLKDHDDRSVRIQVTPSQVTYLVPGLKGISDRMLFATPYQIIDRLAQAFGAHSVCVVLDTNLDRIVAGRIELRKIDGEIFFLRMSAGDSVAYAMLMGLPIYMIESLVVFLAE